MPLSVYSGIAPPPALLRAMSGNTENIPPTSTAGTTAPSAPQRPPSPSFTPDQHPQIIQSHTPIGTGQTHPEEPFPDPQPIEQKQTQQQATGLEGPFPDMPPPTYQEAIADGIGPVGGPRG
ncbi:MAG: hypothetical protein LQ352_004163, partial [Teloschistes flavicans]